MKRIMIMGCSGSGKTTLARQIGKQLNKKVIHLDQYYWAKGWAYEPPKEEWETIVKELIKQKEWVMDGNYGGTSELRFSRADTIIFLDRSRWICLWRVLKRIWKYYGIVRPDMPDGCPERLNWKFIHYVFFYYTTRRPNILKQLEEQGKYKTVTILGSDREVNNYLKKL